MISHIRVLLVDHKPMRLGIRMALGELAEVCAEADDGEQAIRAAKREQPDLCLVSRDLAGDGFAAVRGVSRAAPRTAIVVLAHDGDPDDLLDAVRAGATGYVPGSLNGERLGRIVHAVRAREAVVPRSMVLDLLIELQSGGSGADVLTGREAQVLGMLRRGHSTAAIAKRLAISPVTVRRHISELVHKLGVEDRSELVNDGNWISRAPVQRSTSYTS